MDDIPKSMRRVLDGERIQREWHEKKRKREEGGEKGDDDGRGGKKAKTIEIKVRLIICLRRWAVQFICFEQPEESLKHFNQYVTDLCCCRDGG